MGSFYTNIVIRPATQQSLVDVLRKLRRRAFVSPTRRNVTVVYDAKSETQDTKVLCDLSGRLSRELECTAWGVLNHDYDVFWYVLCSKGEVADWYNSAPDYFGESDEPAPPEGGNAKLLAQLLGRPKSAAELDKILRQPSERYAFASDRHRDLARALGLDFSLLSFGFDDLAGEQDTKRFARVGQ